MQLAVAHRVIQHLSHVGRHIWGPIAKSAFERRRRRRAVIVGAQHKNDKLDNGNRSDTDGEYWQRLQRGSSHALQHKDQADNGRRRCRQRLRSQVRGQSVVAYASSASKAASYPETGCSPPLRSMTAAKPIAATSSPAAIANASW